MRSHATSRKRRNRLPPPEARRLLLRRSRRAERRISRLAGDLDAVVSILQRQTEINQNMAAAIVGLADSVRLLTEHVQNAALLESIWPSQRRGV